MLEMTTYAVYDPKLGEDVSQRPTVQALAGLLVSLYHGIKTKGVSF